MKTLYIKHMETYFEVREVANEKVIVHWTAETLEEALEVIDRINQ